MKTCIIIPAHNEAEEIGNLVKKISQQKLETVLIDDGSDDNTSQVAESCGATVLRNKKNKGKGASLARGFKYALNKGFDAVITMDGDGQHLPEEIPHFIKVAAESDSGILIGERLSQKSNMPFIRLLTNKFMSWLISKVAKQKIADTQCGFRLIKKEVLEKINLRTCKYETESEILVKASRLGLKVTSIPITTVYIRDRSHINPFIDSFRFIRFIVRELWITTH